MAEDITSTLYNIVEQVDTVTRLSLVLAGIELASLPRDSPRILAEKLTTIEMALEEISNEIKDFRKSRKVVISSLGRDLIHARLEVSLETFSESGSSTGEDGCQESPVITAEDFDMLSADPVQPEEMPRSASFGGGCDAS